MDLTSNIIIDIYSILLLAVILIHSLKHSEKESSQYIIYALMLCTSMLILVTDILSRFDGKPDTFYPIINHVGNFMVFLLNPILPSLWLLYIGFQIFHEEKKVKRLYFLIAAGFITNTVMLILSQFNGWYYYIDSNNYYHRGPLFLFSASITVILLSISFIVIVWNRNRIDNKYYRYLLFFPVPPLICIPLQIVFYGISLILNSVVISMLIIFLNIQNRSIYTDYLTGLYNRKKLDRYLRDKVYSSNENKSFSAISIDLNNFKAINDTFGHDIGDNALEIFGNLLKSCVRTKDFVARYGGDEFFIVLDVSDKNDLESMVLRLKNCIKEYNNKHSTPYQLNFSMGYAVYDYNSQMTVEEFQRYIDMLMYEDKREGKEKETRDEKAIQKSVSSRA